MKCEKDIEIIENAFLSSRQEEIEDSYFQKIHNFLTNIRYLNDEYFYYPKEILTELFSDNKGFTLVYYPCDIIDLRKLIKEGFKTDEVYTFLSFDFAKKHCLDNPILLGVETKCKDYGNIFICEKFEKTTIKRVFIREEFVNSKINLTVNKILAEEKLQADINVISDIEGIKKRKILVFNKENNMNSYNLKKAETSFGTGPESGMEGAGIGYEGSQAKEKHKDTVNVNYNAQPDFREGTKVRLNTSFGGGGLSFQQTEGVVVSIKNNRMIVEWKSGKYQGKKSGFDLTDAVSLAKLNKI